MNTLQEIRAVVGIPDSTHPLYRRRLPVPQDAGAIDSNTNYIDLRTIHLPPFGELNTVAQAVSLFDARAAAVVAAVTGFGNGVQLGPSGTPENNLLEEKEYGDVAPRILIPTDKCLGALAYADYFPEVHADGLRPMVSEAILAASPGWCGTIGPAIHDSVTFAAVKSEGNYDMSQMHLLQIAYGYYDELTPAAQEHLITVLLATGRIHRVNKDDIVTSGGVPNDWSTAGFISPLGLHKRIGETENHILTIHTARYLTNQLLYQRDHDPNHDNRRNGSDDSPTCMNLMLSLLRNILRDDFSEYNSKNYQTEVRAALVNLCSYAYDHEVRLAARMVLDYLSAHFAVSSNDLRRLIPFRRLNQVPHSPASGTGIMEVGLLETSSGADPMAQHYAILAGNTRAYETRGGDRIFDWTIATIGENGAVALSDALGEYRISPSIHDLLINDLHRRFYQRLHRVPLDDPEVTGRNCDNYELYAGSPSYLITAGVSPADFAIDPHFLGIVFGPQDKQLGVAVTTSFMATGVTAGPPELGGSHTLQSTGRDAIQFSGFCAKPGWLDSYGVAPDFACGLGVFLPDWCDVSFNGSIDRVGRFRFINRGSNQPNTGDGPGFYLAIYDGAGLSALEAYDTWLHPRELAFEDFKKGVIERNGNLDLQVNVEAEYTTHNGNRIRFLLWDNGHAEAEFGATIVRIDYGAGDPFDALGDAGNVSNQFLNGTILNSVGDGKIEISNPGLKTTFTLDMTDQAHPIRTSETGEVESAGSHEEVWVDFSWGGPNEGDFFHPFNTIAGAAAIVADGGVIKIMPGQTPERPFIQRNSKTFRLVAPIGGVAFGVP